jgi:hypothetical protein
MAQLQAKACICFMFLNVTILLVSSLNIIQNIAVSKKINFLTFLLLGIRNQIIHMGCVLLSQKSITPS